MRVTVNCFFFSLFLGCMCAIHIFVSVSAAPSCVQPVKLHHFRVYTQGGVYFHFRFTCVDADRFLKAVKVM